MKRLLTIAFLAATISIAANAQNCTVSSPCVQLSIVNANAVPSPAALWYCMGSQTSCSQSALDTAKSGQTATNLCPTTQGVWHCSQYTQTKTPQIYNDPQPWGSLMNYSVQGTSGGGVSATPPILTFQVSAPPPQPPSVGSVPTMVTSGTVGPQ